MRSLFAAFGVFVLSVPTAAQTCGIPGVTLSASPPVVAPGQAVQVTVTNGSGQTIQLPSSCAYVAVYPGTGCAAPAVFTPLCLSVLIPIAPGQSYTTDWFQNDDNGAQVPDGTYSFEIWYWDNGFTTLHRCCGPEVIITSCGGASAVTRNGGGTNPLTLASVNPPQLGQSWDTSLDCSAHAPGQASLSVYASAVNGPITPYGQILVGGARLFRTVQPHTGSAVPFSQAVPADLALCGLQASSQGLCFGAPGPQLSNALDLVLGT